MEKLLRCRDLGPDCEFEACAETSEDALRIAVDHARAMHGLKEISEKTAGGRGQRPRTRFVSPWEVITRVKEPCGDHLVHLFHQGH